MIETQESISNWATETFGPAGSNIRVATRANEEMAELLRALSVDENHPKAAEEIADVFIVLYRVATRLRVDIHAEVDRKMQVNRNRQWKLDGTGHGYHVRDQAGRSSEPQEALKPVATIRCMEHREAPQCGESPECGECIRRQCWKDMLGLIAQAIADTPIGTDGRDALAALEESLHVTGIGTFGVADELEWSHQNGKDAGEMPRRNWSEIMEVCLQALFQTEFGRIVARFLAFDRRIRPRL